MSEFSFSLPPDFEDYEWEVESKGWFPGAKMFAAGKMYRLHFYDPVRLAQTIEDDIDRDGVFFEQNLVVVKVVTRSNMEKAADWLVRSGRLSSLVPE